MTEQETIEKLIEAIYGYYQKYFPATLDPSSSQYLEIVLTPDSSFNSEEDWDEEDGDFLVLEICNTLKLDPEKFLKAFPHKLFQGKNVGQLLFLPFFVMQALLGFGEFQKKYREYTIAEAGSVIYQRFYEEK